VIEEVVLSEAFPADGGDDLDAPVQHAATKCGGIM
jgi:hypothetical protein